MPAVETCSARKFSGTNAAAGPSNGLRVSGACGPAAAAVGCGAALAPRPPSSRGASKKREPRDEARAVTQAGVHCMRWLAGPDAIAAGKGPCPSQAVLA